MKLRICSYNIEWFSGLFSDQNTLLADQATTARVDALTTVLGTIDADIIGVVEAPNTAATGARSTTAALENFAATAGIRAAKAMTGFLSAGQQELAFLYDPQRVTLSHDPGGDGQSPADPSFDQEFRIDSDQDGIDEVYRHYRPPLEARIAPADGSAFSPFWAILVHAKSKGIFDRVDFVHWQRMSARNRRKLFAECMSIRQRAEDWMATGRDMCVLGDINDGPGMDGHEARFGRSAVEMIMGDLFRPDRILTSHGGAPTFGDYGWEPSSARFRDQFTGDAVNALIDHILTSPGLTPAGSNAHRVWNPFQLAAAEPMKDALQDASDHFPVTLDIER